MFMAINNVNNNQNNMIVGDPIRQTNNTQNNQQIVGDPIAQNIGASAPASPFSGMSTRDVALNSPEAQRAIQTSLNYLGSTSARAGITSSNAGREMVPRSIVQDDLGM